MMPEAAPQRKTVLGWPMVQGLYVHLAFVVGLFGLVFFKVISGLTADLNRADEPWEIVFVPFLSAMMTYRILTEQPRSPIEKSPPWAVILIAAAFVLHGFGLVTQVTTPSRLAMVLMIQGAILTICGKSIFRRLLFPLLYLFLAIPLPWQVSVLLSTPLKLISSKISGAVNPLWLCGRSSRDGTPFPRVHYWRCRRV